MQLPSLVNEAVGHARYLLQQTLWHPLRYILRHSGRAPVALVLLWGFVLYWGEYGVFEKSAADCAWHRWESWPLDAAPHHVLLVADPQIVDPHTYPGRPWPLSALTVWITDLYMRRTYNTLLKHLQPETTIFLGDLFDGGREWAKAGYSSPEKLYKSYGNDFWLREYGRFMDMFVESWHRHALHRIPSAEGRRIIASVPGNHDLGFANGIDLQVKSRFDAHFGPINRVDVIGNHSFVTVDSVSLSAIDRPDTATGSSGAGDGTGIMTKSMEIWKPVEDFLKNVNSVRSKAVKSRYQDFRGVEKKADRRVDLSVPSSLFPTILLSHVPLYRGENTHCGPMREHGSSIPLAAGYQYQNVLTSQVSFDIIDHLDANQMSMIYSGDDHDYCEIEHSEFTGRIREITVKSISMAMGISLPGVQLASLWNPIDIDAIAQDKVSNVTPKDTIQNHLCLLPFQAGIFLRYAGILFFTVIALAIRAVRYNATAITDASSRPVLLSTHEKTEPLLPLSRTSHTPPSSAIHSNSSSTSSSAARPRGNGRLGGYGNLPSHSRSVSPHKPDVYPEKMDTDDWGYPTMVPTTRPIRSLQFNWQDTHGFLGVLFGVGNFIVNPRPSRKGEFFRSFFIVAVPAFLFYLALLWDEHVRHNRPLER